MTIPRPRRGLPLRTRFSATPRQLGAALVFGIFLLGLWQNLEALHSSQYHPDESRWLNRANYLSALREPTSSRWEDRYLTRGQPPMGSYVTGLGLLLQGRDLTTNGPWDFHFGNESTTTWNAIKGNLPAPGDLIAARRTNAVIGALSCAVLCLIVMQLTHWVGGAVAGIFLAFHPLQIYLASIGVSDAVFTLFLALAGLAALRLAAKPSWWRTLALAAALAAGASTKLSPLFISIPAAGLGVALLLDAPLRRIPHIGRIWALISRGEVGAKARLGWMLLSLPALTAMLFVLSYPYLWPDPIGRTLDLIDFRRDEMENQARIWPASAIDSRREALDRTWHQLEEVTSSSGRAFAAIGNALDRGWSGNGIDLPFAVAGLVVLTWLAWRRGLSSTATLTLLIVGAQAGAILSGLRVDFNRYYLPLVFTSGLGIGILSGWITATLSTLLQRRPIAAVRALSPRGTRARPVPNVTRSRPAGR